MPFDIPYNFRQSLPRCDTITSPMIYDQSLLRKGGKETIYEQWLWHGGHKTTGTARWKPLHGNYGGRSPDHLEGVKAQMKSADSPGKSAPGKGELCTSPRRATKDDGSVHAGVTAGVPNSHFVITPAAIRSPSRLIYRNPSIIPPFRPSHLVLSVFSFCRHVSAFFRYATVTRLDALFVVLDKNVYLLGTQGSGKRQAFREYYIPSRRILNSEIYLRGPSNSRTRPRDYRVEVDFHLVRSKGISTEPFEVLF